MSLRVRRHVTILIGPKGGTIRQSDLRLVESSVKKGDNYKK